jgi:FAD/FMN-containing dehydrogenase
MGGLTKDNTGYDLGSLLCGSEGTLGVVTAARVRLVARSPERVTALVAFSNASAAIEAASSLRRSLPEVQSLEFFLQSGLELVCHSSGTAPPFAERHAAYLLVETAGQQDPAPAMAAALESIATIQDVAVASDSTRRDQLWHLREGHTEAINTLGAPHKLDVTLPAPALAGFIDRVPTVVKSADSDAKTWLFGHVGDGNVHVNVTGVAADDVKVDDRVMRYVAELGGSISAEHGIGTAKRAWLHLNRSEMELATFRRVKAAFDPANIMNPNVLLPPAS